MNLSLAIISLVVLATFMVLTAVADAAEYMKKRKHRKTMGPHVSNHMDLEVGHR